MQFPQGNPRRPTCQEILEEEQARVDHDVDVLPRCYCIAIILEGVIIKEEYRKAPLSRTR